MLDDIPIQWGQKFELYYPDLPGFPTVYVHFTTENHRVYGFPITANFNQTTDKKGSVELTFISNIDLDSEPDLKELAKTELENRFGVSDKVSWNDIKSSCNGNQQYEDFLKSLWIPISAMHGEQLPFGRFYEEIYSIIRFVAAWNPKTGRQSEMRMLYNFVSIFGEGIKIDTKWDHLDFFLLPTYEDVRSENFSDFPKFNELFEAMKIIWNEEFTVETPFKGGVIHSMRGAWPDKKDGFMQKITGRLVSSGKMNPTQKTHIDRLVDMFNRSPPRTSYFVWSIMSIKDTDYKSWSKDDFVKFYLDASSGVGISPKVVACFLQQGFEKEEFIPIDTWVGAFHEHALGIKEQKDFFEAFVHLGKLERLIWIASQANKTNIKSFFDTLWCTRFGNNGNKQLRGANPISCYECKLRSTCPGYDLISQKNVLVVEDDPSVYETITIRQKEITTLANIHSEMAINSNCIFICVTEGNVPKKIYQLTGRGANQYWRLDDEFSGYLLKSQTTNYVGTVVTVKDLVDSLPDASGFNFMEIT
ncbi:hypothetical protein [Nitrosopumilus adriaticus]|uniref:hypothetical protein n=1 Tax=Nitrosopumilus adriaticus TaxID=1580092 RepID=UPI00352EC740